LQAHRFDRFLETFHRWIRFQETHQQQTSISITQNANLILPFAARCVSTSRVLGHTRQKHVRCGLRSLHY
jgi:hypothetical protein